MSASFLTRLLRLPAHDLWRQPSYFRLWTSMLISSFGAQITMLALPLTAATLLQASPRQMGLLIFFEILPFVLFSLPVGVCLDRVKKLPVYLIGEVLLAFALLTVPLAWWWQIISMPWLYLVGFFLGLVNTAAGSAGQIVLTQIVPRERLVEAHAKNAIAGSSAEVAGPAVAGVLVKLISAPLTLLVDAILLLFSALILKGLRLNETLDARSENSFWQDLKQGLHFVKQNQLLVSLALCVGIWQFCYQTVLVVQILFASRELQLSERAIGLCYVCLGLGSVLASLLGHRISRTLGPGPSMIAGFVICAVGWGVLSLCQANVWGVIGFGFMLFCFAVGGVFIFVNFLALRQAVTPTSMLGRMTSTMRWLILLPAAPGALFGGWLGEHFGLRSAMLCASLICLVLAMCAWQTPLLRQLRQLPATPT